MAKLKTPAAGPNANQRGVENHADGHERGIHAGIRRPDRKDGNPDDRVEIPDGEKRKRRKSDAEMEVARKMTPEHPT